MARNRDLVALDKAFKAIPREVRDKVRPAVQVGADEIVARAKYLAPEETGELAASIHTEPGPVDLAVTVVVDDEAALFQEYGTATNSQHRFFWPAVNTLKNRVRRRIDRAIGKAIREAWSK